MFEWCEHDPAPENVDFDSRHDGSDSNEDETDIEFGYDVTATDVDGGGLGRGGWDGTGSGGLHDLPIGNVVPWSAQMKPNRGGSFRRRDPDSFATYTIEYDNPEVKQDDLGFRCCFSFLDFEKNATPVSQQQKDDSCSLFLEFRGEDPASNFNPAFG